jgi:hypothetical protein
MTPQGMTMLRKTWLQLQSQQRSYQPSKLQLRTAAPALALGGPQMQHQHHHLAATRAGELLPVPTINERKNSMQYVMGITNTA